MFVIIGSSQEVILIFGQEINERVDKSYFMSFNGVVNAYSVANCYVN